MNENIRILVVDDERGTRTITEKILNKRGYFVQTVPGGAEALEYLKNNQVEIMICDIEMPVMNGFELLEIVKKQYPDIVVAVMTGYGDTYSVREAMIKGADEYIGKPFTAQALLLIIGRLCWRLSSDGEPPDSVPVESNLNEN